MRYPQNMGKWQRQHPQPHAQWIYKSTQKNLLQPAIDHITLQLAANTPDATLNELHYTTRGTVNNTIQIGTVQQQVQVPVQQWVQPTYQPYPNGPWFPIPNAPPQLVWVPQWVWQAVPNMVQCDALVYSYDFRPNLAAGTLTASNQVNHNDGRYPKRFTGANSAAQPIQGAPRIRDNQTLLQDYQQVKNMRSVDNEVQDFWTRFPKFKVRVSSYLQDQNLSRTVEVRIGGDQETVQTDNHGVGRFYGYPLETAEVRSPPVLPNWTRVRANTTYASYSYPIDFSFAPF